ncbi:acyl-ACP thioesterase domain-containing protein [Actinomycetospora straminea]|uniref:Acyl-ACP thioesterase-like C-terminal domain-containing protein n=1 Tax=Actinomycetospora straminea TaxID=663607 RepID=A0ABP9DYL4_9PSEU|nr:acyl-ACP thioesterase domain-containing protein [Actinomycetospora straminea]MDD7936261.1 thioesterase [Actinomycetospora straminea]
MADSAPVLPAGPTLPGAGPLTDPSAYPVARALAPRYADLGGDGRVTTVALARWFEEARVAAVLPRFRRLVADGGFGPFRILLAAQRIRRLAPTTLDVDLRVGLRIGSGVRRIGGSSYSWGHGVFAGERCVAVSDSVTVLATGAGPSELPDELRADLAALAIDEPGDAAPRPEAARREHDRYPLAHRITTRISDVDTNRHVNNVAVLSWYADAVATWQSAQLGDPDGGPPEDLAPVAWDVQYVDEVAHPRTYDVALAVDPTPDGLHYRAGVFAGERCVGLADGIGAAGPWDADGSGWIGP